MKKFIVLLITVLFIGLACIPKPPDITKIKEIVDSLDVENRPDDQKVDIVIEGLPEELPQGMDGINVYVSEDSSLKDLSAEEAEEYKVNNVPITENTIQTVEGLSNGTKYVVQIRAVVEGDPLDEGSRLYAFYPRPTGTMELSWGAILLTAGNMNAFGFNRNTGHPEVCEAVEENKDKIDFVVDLVPDDKPYLVFKSPKKMWDSGNDAYIRNPNKSAEEWYEHIEGEANTSNYSDSMKVSVGMIYEIATWDNYYGKIVVDSIWKDGNTWKAVVRWAFQTKQGVAGY